MGRTSQHYHIEGSYPTCITSSYVHHYKTKVKIWPSLPFPPQKRYSLKKTIDIRSPGGRCNVILVVWKQFLFVCWGFMSNTDDCSVCWDALRSMKQTLALDWYLMNDMINIYFEQKYSTITRAKGQIFLEKNILCVWKQTHGSLMGRKEL